MFGRCVVFRVYIAKFKHCDFCLSGYRFTLSFFFFICDFLRLRIVYPCFYGLIFYMPSSLYILSFLVIEEIMYFFHIMNFHLLYRIPKLSLLSRTSALHFPRHSCKIPPSQVSSTLQLYSFLFASSNGKDGVIAFPRKTAPAAHPWCDEDWWEE